MVGQSGSEFTYDGSTDFGTGQSGCYSDKTGVTFDNFQANDANAREALTPHFSGMADASISAGSLLITGTTRGGEAVLDGFNDDDFMIVSNHSPGADFLAVWFRYQDANNSYLLTIKESTDRRMSLQKVVNGKASSLASAVTYNILDNDKFSLKVNGTSIKVWHDGNLKFNVTDSTFAAGGIAFSWASPSLADLKVGYDNNGDDDIDDVGDDLVVNTSFTSTSVTFGYDDAGNLVDDGNLVYTYDAWNRLVTVEASEDTDTKIADYEYDAKGRRIKKVVTNSGELDGTELFYYNNRWQAIEVRDGSENVVRQVYHGAQYIDEIVAERLPNGVAFVHQDANWNVKVLTDFAGQVLERYDQTPYGIITVDQETMFGDGDNDGFVKVADWDTNTNGSLDSGDSCWGSNPTGDCRLIDLDFDGDVDATDATTLTNLASSDTYRRPGLAYSVTVGNRRAHQGLVYDPETFSYQNRNRQYLPPFKTFGQRDLLTFLRGRLAVGAHYMDGLNLLEYVRSNPLAERDALGLAFDSGAPNIGDDCSFSEGDTGPCNVTTCCRCGGKIGTFQTTTNCTCSYGPGGAGTIWLEICGGWTSGHDSGCRGAKRPGNDSTACGSCKHCKCPSNLR